VLAREGCDTTVYEASDTAGGGARTLYTFHTPVSQPRPFAVDGEDLYVVEANELVYIPSGGEPLSLVSEMGAAITHIAARPEAEA